MLASDWPLPAGNARVWLAGARATGNREAAGTDKAGVRGCRRGGGCAPRTRRAGTRAPSGFSRARALPSRPCSAGRSVWWCWFTTATQAACAALCSPPARSKPAEPNAWSPKRTKENGGPVRRQGSQTSKSLVIRVCHLKVSQRPNLSSVSTLYNYSHRRTPFLEATQADLLSKYN